MTQSPIRLVVSDVDGTLVTGEKLLTAAAIDAAARLRAAGIMLALTSSRPPRGLDMVYSALHLTTPRAGFNGGEIVAADGAVLERHAVPAAAARRTIAYLDEQGVDVWLFADGAWMLRGLVGPYVAKERRTVQFDPIVVDSFEPFIDRAGKLVGSTADFALLARCETALQAMLGHGETHGAAAHLSQKYYLDVTHVEANKGHAARALARILGVDMAEVACIGDMTNDVPMFAVAGLAIAMGNAPPAVQARAHVVTASNEEDGFAAAVDRYILPRAPRRAAP